MAKGLPALVARPEPLPAVMVVLMSSPGQSRYRNFPMDEWQVTKV